MENVRYKRVPLYYYTHPLQTTEFSQSIVCLGETDGYTVARLIRRRARSTTHALYVGTFSSIKSLVKSSPFRLILAHGPDYKRLLQ